MTPKNIKVSDSLPPLRTTKLGRSVGVYYDSLLLAVGVDPANEPADRPITVTIKEAMRRIGKSRSTVVRMIQRGSGPQAGA